MADVHHTLPEAIKEACNVNQFKERERETWGRGWRGRNQEGLWAGEEERLNTLGSVFLLKKVSRYTGNSK